MRIQRTMDGDSLVLMNPESGEIVRIQESVAEGRAVLRPEGRLTQEMSHDLEDELTAMTLMCPEVVLEMPRVSYIAGSVMRRILEIQHMMDAKDGSLFLKDVPDNIYRKFEEMGLDGVLEISRIGEE